MNRRHAPIHRNDSTFRKYPLLPPVQPAKRNCVSEAPGVFHERPNIHFTKSQGQYTRVPGATTLFVLRFLWWNVGTRVPER